MVLLAKVEKRVHGISGITGLGPRRSLDSLKKEVTRQYSPISVGTYTTSDYLISQQSSFKHLQLLQSYSSFTKRKGMPTSLSTFIQHCHNNWSSALHCSGHRSVQHFSHWYPHYVNCTPQPKGNSFVLYYISTNLTRVVLTEASTKM